MVVGNQVVIHQNKRLFFLLCLENAISPKLLKELEGTGQEQKQPFKNSLFEICLLRAILVKCHLLT